MLNISFLIKKMACLIIYSSAILILFVSNAVAGDNQVEFKLTDNPGRWFDTGTAVAGNRSIAIASPGVRVKFPVIPIRYIRDPV